MRIIFALILAISFSAQAAEVAEVTDQPVAESVSEATASVDKKMATENLKESEIPLNLEKSKKATEEGGSFFRILMALSMLGVIGTGAFIFLRKYAIPKGMKHQTQIKVLQQHFLGPKKSLAIVRVAGESILIGVTEHNISMIKSLSLLDDEVPEEAPQSFDNVMKESKNREFTNTTTLDADEEFAISGVKDIVSKRLKGMRSFQ